MHHRLTVATAVASAIVLALAAGSAARAEPAAAAVAPAAAGLTPAGNAATAARAAALLESRYTVPAIGRRYAAALRAHAAAGRYADVTDRGELARRITADCQAVAKDGHIHAYVSEAPHPPRTGQEEAAATPPGPAPADDSIEALHRLGFRDARWLEPGVAYLSFEHLDSRPEAVAALDRFLVSHAGARALVIDSRDNHGGGFEMLGVFGNRLFAAERHLADMDVATAVVRELGAPFPIDGRTLRQVPGPTGLTRYQHWSVPAADAPALFAVPVYYLTSRHTFSAAEHLAMILKTTGRATLIGEPTGGGNHFGGTEDIGSGLELFVPIGRTSDPATGLDWEGVGVQPDVPVAADGALAEALARIHTGR